MIAKHPPQSNPNRGYSFVGQENVANISGYEKGKAGLAATKDIKVRERKCIAKRPTSLTATRRPLI